MRHHRSEHINAPFTTAAFSGTDEAAWSDGGSYRLRACRVFGKTEKVIRIGYNMIDKTTFSAVNESSLKPVALVQTTDTGISGRVYLNNFLKTTVALRPGINYTFTAKAETGSALSVYAGERLLVEIPAGSGTYTGSFTAASKTIELYLRQPSDVECRFTLGELMLYNTAIVSHQYEPYTGGVMKPDFIVNNCTYSDGTGSARARDLAAVGDVCDEHDLCTGCITRRIGVIKSYGGETVTGDYITPGGSLTSGSLVFYVLPEPRGERTAAVRLGDGSASGSIARTAGDVSGTRIELELTVPRGG